MGKKSHKTKTKISARSWNCFSFDFHTEILYNKKRIFPLKCLCRSVYVSNYRFDIYFEGFITDWYWKYFVSLSLTIMFQNNFCIFIGIFWDYSFFLGENKEEKKETLHTLYRIELQKGIFNRFLRFMAMLNVLLNCFLKWKILLKCDVENPRRHITL